MHIHILQENLSKGLTLVSRHTSNKGQLPILANVLISAQTEGVTLLATNLEMGIRVNIGGKTEKPGQITVPAKNLTEFISSLPVETVELRSEGEKLKISCGKSNAVFSTTDAKEFPIIPVPSGGHLEIDSHLIKQVASEVAFASATDESRPVLTGVRFEKQNEYLVITATDGFRLSRKNLLAPSSYQLTTIILPARTIMELAKVGDEEKISMEVVSQNNQVIFTSGKTQIISRILEGNFPDVDKIIPKEFRTQVTVERGELLRAVRAAGIFARDSNNIVKFEIRPAEREKFEIKASGGQTGESESLMDAEIDGDEIQISFNYKYVLDFLNSVGEERIIMKFNESTTPAVFVPEKDSSLVHLIMPVRV
ncbi:MAG: DNA polymerase III subunit beta [Patescibacteria group bacterium]